VIAAVAASGAVAVALPVSAAFAADGATADGAAVGSPGLISGNAVQLPVHVPVNVCGNTVDVVGLLNPASGNACANGGGADTGTGTSAASGGAAAHGGAKDSPGVLSGNDIQLPVHVPVNVSGNSVNVIGVGNPAHDNTSVNGPSEPTQPRTPAPASHPRAPEPAPVAATLAHTGADLTAPALAGSAAFIVTGAALYRRFRPGRSH
jgi:hypothetical protein